ncbi:MAG: DUF3300 domain-containing protein [Gammaproteobacteria bacterium]|nr:DUF3300 domain-containing protein [Gammaproteobacteria bacterium]
MNSESMHIKVKQYVVLLGALGLLAAGSASAQVPVDDNGNPVAAMGNSDSDAARETPEIVLLPAAELEQLVGPVALYPDDLLAVVLPASTFPLQIVQAARYLERFAADKTLQPDDDWDESIVALLNYPEVVNLLNDDLDWTWKLGEAVVAQQNDVIAAVETFRDRAYAAGNLKTDKYQTVSNNDGIIEIDPVQEDVIYVPYYEPARVVTYSARPVYNYYPRPYPLYYYPYAADYSFGSGYFWGVTTAFSIGWTNDYLNVYHNSYYGHPYYGRSYYFGNNYWRRPSIHAYNNYYGGIGHNGARDYNRYGDYWRPRRHGGARPGHQLARSNYYSGARHSNSRGAYRDGRTDGLAYNRNTHSTRSTTSTNRGRRNDGSHSSNNRSGSRFAPSNQHSNRNASVSPRASAPRPAVQFRQRSNHTYTGSVAPRLQRSANSSNRQSSRRTNTARANTTNNSRNAVRFRARESSASRSRANTTAHQGRRANTSARTTPTNRSTFAANNAQRTTRHTTRRPAAASGSAQTRRFAPARGNSGSRQSTAHSQPRRETVSRQASPPRQSRRASSSHSSAPRSSARPRSGFSSKGSAKSSGRNSSGHGRSSRGHK